MCQKIEVKRVIIFSPSGHLVVIGFSFQTYFPFPLCLSEIQQTHPSSLWVQEVIFPSLKPAWCSLQLWLLQLLISALIFLCAYRLLSPTSWITYLGCITSEQCSQIKNKLFSQIYNLQIHIYNCHLSCHHIPCDQLWQTCSGHCQWKGLWRICSLVVQRVGGTAWEEMQLLQVQLISKVVPWEVIFCYIGKVSFSLTHKLGVAASALKPPLVRICSENVSLLTGLESHGVLSGCMDLHMIIRKECL